MAQNEIIEGMAVEEVVASKPRFGKKVVIGLAAAGAIVVGLIFKAISRKDSSNEEAYDYETEDYEDITEDDENPVDSDVE